jgi:predicted HTH domain antitoxin
MTRHAVMTGVTLYRTGTVTLEQAANCGGTTSASLAASLRSRGIPVREEPAPTETDADAAR